MGIFYFFRHTFTVIPFYPSMSDSACALWLNGTLKDMSKIKFFLMVSMITSLCYQLQLLLFLPLSPWPCHFLKKNWTHLLAKLLWLGPEANWEGSRGFHLINPSQACSTIWCLLSSSQEACFKFFLKICKYNNWFGSLNQIWTWTWPLWTCSEGSSLRFTYFKEKLDKTKLWQH